MSDRFPPLRDQCRLQQKSGPGGQTLSAPAPVDLTLLAALAFVVALALI